MARRYEVTVGWAAETLSDPFQHRYECDSYSVTAESNLLTMHNVLWGGFGFHVVGIPLGTVQRYTVVDRQQRRVDP